MRVLGVVLMAMGLLSDPVVAQQSQKQSGPTVMRPPPDSYFADLPDQFAKEAARYRDWAKSGKINEQQYGVWASQFMDRIVDFKNRKKAADAEQAASMPTPEPPPPLPAELVR